MAAGRSFLDTNILQVSGCVRIYSEDLQRGRRYDGAEIVNPFA